MTKFIRAISGFTTGVSIPNLIRIFLFLFLFLSIPLTVISLKTAENTRSFASSPTVAVIVYYDKNKDGYMGSDEQFGRFGNQPFSSSTIGSVTINGVPVTLNSTGVSPVAPTVTIGSPITARLSLNSGWAGTGWYSQFSNCVLGQCTLLKESAGPYTSPPYTAVTPTLTSNENAFTLWLGIYTPPAPTCTNQCSSGAKQCASATSYQTCGDYNGDGCLEWATTSCPPGQTCSSGNCVTSGGGTSGGGNSGGKKTSGGVGGTLDSLQLEITVPYLVGSLKAKADVGGVSKDIEITPANKNYTLDLKGSNLSLNKEYTLIVTSGKTLVRKVKFTPTTSSTTVQVADLLLGDINQDNSIDSTDQISLVDSIASQTSTGDLNADTATNSMDWAILLTNFGKKGD